MNNASLNSNINQELINKMQEDALNGKTKSQISLELGVPYHSVLKYTRGINSKRMKTIPQEQVEQIRNQVKNGKMKCHIAKELNVSLWTVRKYTEDLPSKAAIIRKTSPDLIKKIRSHVKEGNTKSQTAKELDVSLNVVCKYTKDMPRRTCMSSNINGKALVLLRRLMQDGYAFGSPEYGLKEYQILKHYFPTIYRTKQYGKLILYLDDKAKIAAKALFEKIDNKIISYKELKQITKCFGVKFDKDDKKRLLLKKQSSRRYKTRVVQKKKSLREKDDSFSFSCIRNYCFVIRYTVFYELL